MKRIIVLLFLLAYLFKVDAQMPLGNDSVSINYSSPTEYEVGGITVSGTEYLDKTTLILISGLSVGDKLQVPGDKFSQAIENLWKQGLFEDVKIIATKISGKNIFLEIKVVERPRLSKFSFKGIKKSEADDLRKEIRLVKGKVLTDYLMASTVSTIKEHFIDKGYQNVTVNIKQQKDTSLIHTVILYINIQKGKKVKIQEIFVHGNTAFSEGKIRRIMKDTKRRRWYVFASAKYLEENYEKDKQKIIDKYHQRGYRDAKIAKDSVYKSIVENRVNIDMTIDEGRKYYFRNIAWVGNTKYSSKELGTILGIKKGDVFDQSVLDAKLYMNPSGADISSLYMDDGYLFFQVNPTEILVEGDSIDFEMRIYEGKRAIINKVTVSGNTKTNDRVIMREIRTRPGQLFRRSDIIRSQRELSQLGYFNPEKMNVIPTPDPAKGTVDIEYVVEEKSSDQLSLSGGWGAGRVVGTLGVVFNNFSTKNILKSESWRPLPSGDGQRLSVSAQSNGLYYQSINLSFTEPWLGGKKPNSMTYTTYYSVQNPLGLPKSNDLQQLLRVTGVALGFSKRLKVPDDYFTLYQEANYQHYELKKFALIPDFRDGYANNINYKINISRNSIDKPIFETRGSQIAFTAQLTPPYSLFNGKDYSLIDAQEKFKFLEYQKYKFTAAWYTSLTNKRGSEGQEARNLVLYTKFGFGFLAAYNQKTGLTPFERFYLGGSGLHGFALDGREIIGLRGYTDQGLAPADGRGATTICKYTAELRYPISLSPMATIYALTFAEAGNSWGALNQFNPFDVKRSAGVGLRIFMPMFGLLGFDYGWGLDYIDGRADEGRNFQTGKPKGQFHFIIGYALGEL